MDTELIQSAYNKCELVDIYLNNNALQRVAEFNINADLKDIKQQHKQSVKADFLALEPDSNTPEVNPFLLRCFVELGVRFVREDEQVQAEIEATFCAVYICKEELTETELNEFVRFNVVHNVWPFWREHAFRVSAEAKLPRPSISLMRPKA